MTSHLLNSLSKLMKINQNFTSIQHKFNKSVKKVSNIKSNDNSIIDCIKVCRSHVKDIELNENSNKLKSFSPKSQITKNKSDLQENHKKIHKNIKPFECEKCGKKLLLRHHLETHEVFHSNKRQFVCDWSQCEKRCNTVSDLNKHKKVVHLKERNYVCDYNDCKKRFICKSHLNIHKRIDSGEKPFVCNESECDKKFKTKQHLTSHMKFIHKKKH